MDGDARDGGRTLSCVRTYLFSNEHGLRNTLVCPGDIHDYALFRSHGDTAFVVKSSVPLQYFTDFSHDASHNERVQNC